MSRKPTDVERNAFREIVSLKRERDILEKEIVSSTKELSKKKRDIRKGLIELLGQGECMKVDDRFIRRMTVTRLQALKPEHVCTAIMEISRAEVMAQVNAKQTVWDALLSCIVKKINHHRRKISDTIAISQKNPPKKTCMVETTDDMKKAILSMDNFSEQINAAKGDKPEKKKEIEKRMDPYKEIILKYMKRADKNKQDIHIGVVDNIQRSFHVCRKRKKQTKLTIESAKAKITDSFSQMQTLDEFLEKRNYSCMISFVLFMMTKRK